MKWSVRDFLKSAYLLLLAFVLCDVQRAQAQAPDLDFYGYRRSASGRKLAGEALVVANSLLAGVSKLKLRQEWTGPDKKAAETDVTVVLIAPTAVPFVIQVPHRSCRCIFLQMEAFRKSLGTYSGRPKQMMAIEPSHMLAFMLLHEVGHIESGDPGAFEKEGADFNYDDTVFKERERGADQFAAKALTAPTKDTAGFLNGMKVRMTLSHASWNLTAVRLLDNFGGSTLCSKSLFADRGLSHPNFELRILAVNDILSNSPTSRELVEQFEDCRKPGRR